MRALIVAIVALLAGGVGYELGHVVGYHAGARFEARWCTR